MDDAPRILGGRYEVGELIGRGGMAEVHIGHDTRLGRTVAIKILRSDLARDPSFQARFRREAQAAASLNHPAVVAVYDTGEDVSTEPGGAVAHVPFIVMEYVEGHTVRDILRDGAAVPIEEAVEITAGVLSALEYSHHAGIVHRDIKPANVMLTPTGAVKVMDFGIARAMADSAGTMTQTQAVIGTAQYLSPEQARGESVDSRSDLYSTGCLLFELLTGRPPFIGDSPVAVAYQHAREEPQPPSTFASDVPEQLDRITMKALAKDREHRYRSASEFRSDLEAVLRGGPVSAPAVGAAAAALGAAGVLAAEPAAAATQVLGTSPTQVVPGPAWGPTAASPARPTPGSPAPVPEEPRRRTWLIWLLVGIAVLAIAGIAWALLQGQEQTPETATVPDVVGMSQAEAVATIEEAGLVATPLTEPSLEVPFGQVTRTDPEEGTELPLDGNVDVYVSSGAEAVAIPEMTNFSRQQAIDALTALGFPSANITVTTEDSGTVEKDKVTRSEPAAGESADPTKTLVTVYLSTGNVQAPSTVGQPFDTAKAALEALGLTVDQVEQETPDVQPGTVIAQDRTGTVPQRTNITLTTAIAPTVEMTTVPDGLENTDCTAALAKLGNAGLNGVCVAKDGTQAAGSWVVTKATPASGTEVEVGSTVTLEAEENSPPANP